MSGLPLSPYWRKAGTAVLGLALAALLPAAGAQAAGAMPLATNVSGDETFQPQSGQAGKDVIWVPTPDSLVDAMLDMTALKAGELHFDLGSGDGKIVIAAARRGARSTGVEYNADMVGLSRRNAERAGLADRASFIQGDIFETDFSRADVITLYLLPMLNLKLRPQLLAMKPGTRIASHQFSMGDWEPDQRITLDGRDALAWVVPARIGGSWAITVEGQNGKPVPVRLDQSYQRFSGSATLNGARADVLEGRIDGSKLGFSLVDAKGEVLRFKGSSAEEGQMAGTVTDARGTVRPFRATRVMTVTGQPDSEGSL